MAAYLVQAAGSTAVNGAYVRGTQTCNGAHVFRKKGTNYALIRRGENHWTLADLGGGSPDRWNLRSVELYACHRTPGGQTPPDFGWNAIEGAEPGPLIHPAKMQISMSLPQLESLSPKAKQPFEFQKSLTKQSVNMAPKGVITAVDLRRASAVNVMSSPPLFATSPAALASGLAPGTNWHVFFVNCFSVALVRPSKLHAFGYNWSEATYQETGSRDIESIDSDSPLARWNIWQRVRGRLGCCVRDGDRLIRADGRWSFFDSEVGNADNDDSVESAGPLREKGPASRNAPAITMQSASNRAAKAMDPRRSMVLEFGRRDVLRPVAPLAPKCLAPDTEGLLFVQWEPRPWEPRELAYALVVQDVSVGLWYTVEESGTAKAGTARPVACGKDVGSLSADDPCAMVTRGLAQGRAYAACVAVFTEGVGWSAFSAMSRPVVLKAQIKWSETLMKKPPPEPEDWATRPRYCVPSQLVPGTTCPVEVEPGRPEDNTFLGRRRWIRLQFVMPGSARSLLDRGLRIEEVGTGRNSYLKVDRVNEDCDLARWSREQRSTAMEVHGAVLVPGFIEGDRIMRVNGLTSAKKMKKEITRNPTQVAVVVDRLLGPDHLEPEDELFEIDPLLDGEAVKSSEEIQINVLLPPAEGQLALSIVGCEMEHVEVALDAVLRASAEAAAAAGGKPPRYTYPKVVSEAESRVLLFYRRMQASSGKDVDAAAKDQENEDAAFLGMKAAMADVSANPDNLRSAINRFGTASTAVISSPAAQRLLHRANSLLWLWSWRTRFALIKLKLDETVKEAAGYEGVDGEEGDENSDSDGERDQQSLYEVSRLERALQEAEEFHDMMPYEIAEAHQVLARQTSTNASEAYKMEIFKIARDKREDKVLLQSALQKAKDNGVKRSVTTAAERVLEIWEAKHKRDAAREALVKALQGLSDQLDRRDKPGAGAEEQRILRESLAVAGLPEGDQLAEDATRMLARWKHANSVLRAEAKLMYAVQHCVDGYKVSGPRSGDRLGSAIAEVSTEGVDARSLDEARAVLTNWENSRRLKAEDDLDKAMQYADVEQLKEAINFATIAGFLPEELETHRAKLQHLRWEEEINKQLAAAMEGKDTELLCRVIATAHDKLFVEEESIMLNAGTLQVHLRFWVEQFRMASQAKDAEGLAADVKIAEALIEKADKDLEKIPRDSDTLVAAQSLEKDLRGLKLLMPKVKDMAAVHSAEAELNRVLLAVERYAADLPSVIEMGNKQVGAGLKRSLLTEAMDHKKSYDKLVKELQKAIDDIDNVEGHDLKDTLVKARLAGAPQQMVDKASELLDEKFPELFAYLQIELELLVALREADDISELSVEGRFLRLQNAADEAKKLNPPLDTEVLVEIDQTSIALAAERTLALQMVEAELVFKGGRPGTPGSHVGSRAGSRRSGSSGHRSGKSGSGRTNSRADRSANSKAKRRRDQLMASGGMATADEVEQVAEALRNACLAAEQSALAEAQKSLPAAEALRDRLMEEAKRRREAVIAVEKIAAVRQGTSKELRAVITTAREVGVPEALLSNAYMQLRQMKVAFLSEDFQAALIAGHRILALACYHRAQGLNVEKMLSALPAQWMNSSDTVTIKSTMMGHRVGGSFGSETWRHNPYFRVEHPFASPAGSDKGTSFAKATSKPVFIPTKVTVAVADGAETPSTLQVHAVRNSREATDAGCKNILAPGYEVLAACNQEDDLPVITFELPPSDDNRSVFIVVSAAKGEEGPFTLVVEGGGPLSITEVSEVDRQVWHHKSSQNVSWQLKRPLEKYMGGGRYREEAPPLSWYRNPQFKVRLKSKRALEDEAKRNKSEGSELVSSFPFAQGPSPSEPAGELAESSVELSTLPEESSRIEVVTCPPVGTDVVVTADAGVLKRECLASDLETAPEQDLGLSSSVAEVNNNNGTVRLEAGQGNWIPVRALQGYEIVAEAEPVDNVAAPLGVYQTSHRFFIAQATYNVQPLNAFSDAAHFQGMLVCTCTVEGAKEPAFRTAEILKVNDGPVNPQWNHVGKIMDLPTDVCVEFEVATNWYTLGENPTFLEKHVVGKAVLTPDEIECVRPESAIEGDLAIQDASGLDVGMLYVKVAIEAPEGGAQLGRTSNAMRGSSAGKKAPVPEIKRPPSGGPAPPAPLLQVLLLPADGRPVVPAAVHIVRSKEDHRISENPRHHTVVACSGTPLDEYQVASDVGAVCSLRPGATESEDGEPVFVIPSLDTCRSEGSFKLQFHSTEPIIVEKVN